jgi:cysteine synthase A
MRFRSLQPDAFVAGVGTGGTIMGVGRYLKEQDASIRIYPLEPYNSPTLSTGHKVGKHRIQGISDEFIPSIVDLESLDTVVSVDDGDAIIMASRLASELGIGVGISSGANLLGALKVQDKLGRDKIVVSIFPDDNKKYLSTDLLKEEPVKDLHLSKDVELVNFRSFKRVCHTCCDPENCVEKNFVGDLGVHLPHCARRA